ncbi:MAG: hypothetical protein K0S46_2223 [Moraxellaceae bacterium]|nr:hypothetical protein [Moraxellaceae bacterium]
MQPQVITTSVLFEGIKALLRKENMPDTPYGVAKYLGASRQCGYTWRDGKTVMDDFYAIKAALMLGHDPDFVLACLAAERATRCHNDETAAVWHSIARRLATAASVCFLLALPVLVMQNPAF